MEQALQAQEEFIKFAQSLKLLPHTPDVNGSGSGGGAVTKRDSDADPLDQLVRLMEDLCYLRTQQPKWQRRTTLATKKANGPSKAGLGLVKSTSSKKVCTLPDPDHAVSSRSKRSLQRSNRLPDEDDSLAGGVKADTALTMESPSTKVRSGAWNKVKDAIRRELQEFVPSGSRLATATDPGGQAAVLRQDITASWNSSRSGSPRKSFSAGGGDSRSSSSSQRSSISVRNRSRSRRRICSAKDIGLTLDFGADVNNSMARSSSFSQVSELMPLQIAQGSIRRRRHSLTSLEAQPPDSNPDTLKEEDEQQQLQGQPQEEEEEEEKKTSRTAWGKMKNMIYTRRDSLKNKKECPAGVSKHAFKADVEEDQAPLEKSRPSPKPLCRQMTTPADGERPILRTMISVTEDPASGKSPQTAGLRSDQEVIRWTDKMRKVLASGKKDDDLMAANSLSLPSSPLRNSAVFFYDDATAGSAPTTAGTEQLRAHAKDLSGSQSSADWHGLQGEIQRNYEQLQRRLSEEFQRKMQNWDKGKGSLAKDSPFLPSSPTLASGRSRSAQPAFASDPACLELNLSPDFKRKYEEWQKKKQDQVAAAGSAAPGGSASQNQKADDSTSNKKIRARPLGQQVVQNECDLKPEFRLKVAEWEVRKALVGQGCKNVEEIRKLMPDDFNRKLEEWEMIKESERKSSESFKAKKPADGRSDAKRRSVPEPKSGEHVVLSASETPGKAGSQRERDSIWLDKELLAVKRELQRLEREKHKCLEKEERLQKMKEALRHCSSSLQHHHEITVKTAKGEEFTFAGISDQFTKKLFEWEEQRGIAPESSTIALLNGKADLQQFGNEPPSADQACKKEGNLRRSRSEGSLQDDDDKRSSDGNLSQNSSQSLNDLQMLADPFIATSSPSTAVTASARHSSTLLQKPPLPLCPSPEPVLPVPPGQQNVVNCHSVELLLDIERLLDRLDLESVHLLCPACTDHQQLLSHKLMDCSAGLRRGIQDLLEHQRSIPAAGKVVNSESDLSLAERATRARSSVNSVCTFDSEPPFNLLPLHPEVQADASSTSGHPQLEQRRSKAGASESSTQLPVDGGPPSIIRRSLLFMEEDEEMVEDDEEERSLRPLKRDSSESEDRNPLNFGRRRTSSENLSSPNSGRSRSPSLLSSSDYIPEEQDHFDCKSVGERESSSLCHAEAVKTSMPRTSVQSPPTSIDQLCQLVHDLKQEDLSYHKELIAKKEAARRAAAAVPSATITATTSTVTSSIGNPPVDDLWSSSSSSCSPPLLLDVFVSTNKTLFPALTKSDQSAPDQVILEEDSGILYCQHVRPSLVKKDPSKMLLSMEGKCVVDSHIRTMWKNPVLIGLGAGQEGVRRSASGHSAPQSGAETSGNKEPLVHSRSLPLGANQNLDLEQQRPATSKHELHSLQSTDLRANEIVCLSKSESNELDSCWQTLSQRRSQQLMKAKEQFFLGHQQQPSYASPKMDQ